MAYHSQQSGNQRTLHLDASGPREVVYCHQCAYEWYQDEYGLVCPYCNGSITEIITPGDDDPRQLSHRGLPSSPLPRHNLWSGDIPDLDDANIQENITPGRNSTLTFSHSPRTSNPNLMGEIHNDNVDMTGNITDHVLTEFRNMVSNFVGPQPRHDAPARSGSQTLVDEHGIHTRTFRFSGNGNEHSVMRGHFMLTNTFNEGLLRPRNTDEPQSAGAPPVHDIASIIENILASVSDNSAPTQTEDSGNPHAGPVSLQAIFSAMLLPINFRAGDAVHSQEALDQIISALMEQYPTSNAPGPAPPEAIAALPKKKLDKTLLGDDEKGECNICMDDIKIGNEVVVLPCHHWFDEACVSAWLNEHNTCPICRKGIDENVRSSSSQNSRPSANVSASRNRHTATRLGSTRPRVGGVNSLRNDERLNYLRNAAGVNLSEDTAPESLANQLPGSFQRRSSDISAERDNRGAERTRNLRSRSASGSSVNVGGNGALNWLRVIQDRFSNNRRNE